jgi:NAD(P)-dependent dehydrogenase (short-subunit alcohol dehydrogenase family)
VKRTALVTGASRGIGRAIAVQLARDGAAVGVNYANAREHAESVCAEIAAAGGRAAPLHADISQREQVLAMVAELTAKFGAPDILVNNAGVLIRGDLADFDFSQMDRMRGVNVDGLVHVTRACVGAMKDRGWGRHCEYQLARGAWNDECGDDVLCGDEGRGAGSDETIRIGAGSIGHYSECHNTRIHWHGHGDEF